MSEKSFVFKSRKLTLWENRICSFPEIRKIRKKSKEYWWEREKRVEMFRTTLWKKSRLHIVKNFKSDHDPLEEIQASHNFFFQQVIESGFQMPTVPRAGNFICVGERVFFSGFQMIAPVKMSIFRWNFLSVETRSGLGICTQQFCYSSWDQQSRRARVCTLTCTWSTTIRL